MICLCFFHRFWSWIFCIFSSCLYLLLDRDLFVVGIIVFLLHFRSLLYLLSIFPLSLVILPLSMFLRVFYCCLCLIVGNKANWGAFFSVSENLRQSLVYLIYSCLLWERILFDVLTLGFLCWIHNVWWCLSLYIYSWSCLYIVRETIWCTYARVSLSCVFRLGRSGFWRFRKSVLSNRTTLRMLRSNY